MLAVQPVRIFVERPQGLGRVLGKLVDRIAVFLEVFHPGGDIDHPHEAAEDRLGGAAGDADDRLGRPQGVRHGLRGEDDQGAVHPLVLDHGGKGLFVTVGRGVPDDVHGIVDVGRGGEMARQLVDRLLLELRQFEIGGDGHVGRQDPRSAGVGHDGHPFAAGDLPLRLAEGAFALVGKGIGEIEELGDGIGPDDPGLLEDGVVDRLRPGQGAGVGGGRLGAGARPSRLDDQSPGWAGGRR